MYAGAFLSVASPDPVGKKKVPALTVSPARRLLEVVLPLKVFQAEDMLRLMADLQQRNYRAYLAHRKRRLCETLY